MKVEGLLLRGVRRLLVREELVHHQNGVLSATSRCFGLCAREGLGPFLIAVARRDEPAAAVRANRMLS